MFLEEGREDVGGGEGRCCWRRRGKMLFKEEREDVVGGGEGRCCWRSRVEMLLKEKIVLGGWGDGVGK
jgi:hypothetical protein